MKVKTLVKAINLVALGVVSSSAMSAGFQVSEKSAASLGRAFAGDGAIGDSAAILGNNPAGMVLLDGSHFTAHISYVDPSIELSGYTTGSAAAAPGLLPVDGVTTFSDVNATSSAVVPSVFYTRTINDQITAGIGMFSDFGFATEYPADFAGLEMADLSDIVSVNINPSIAYKVNDKFSVGAGISIVYMHAEISSTRYSGAETCVRPDIAGVPASMLPCASTVTPLPPTIDPLPIQPGMNVQQLDGNDVTWGWNIGGLYQFTDNARIGLSYRSEVEADLDGDVTSDLQPAWNGPGAVEITLPSILELAAHLQVNDNWAVHGSYYRVGWSSFKEIAPTLDSGAPFPVTPENWSDTDRFAAGVTYTENEWTVRAGIMYDESPVSDEYRTLRIPDADRQWYSVGVSYEVCGNCTIDFGYSYIGGDKALIEEESPLNPVTGGAIGVGEIHAMLDASGHVFSFGYNYKF